MNRLQFIQTFKSVLIIYPLVRSFNFEEINKICINQSIEKSKNLFPDKENYLIAATCLFGTPNSGDGKNKNNSYIDVFVDVECYDNIYSAHGGFGDNTEINKNEIRDMGIGFSEKNSKKIFYDGVKNINITIFGHKPDQDEIWKDEWNIRWEFMMKFKKGNILSTGYNDPSIPYKFTVEHTPLNAPETIKGRKSFFDRSDLKTNRTLHIPIG